MFDLDSNLLMDICECTCEEDIQITTWKCFAGDCYELNDSSGAFTSLEECELSCNTNDTTWKCSLGSCVEIFNLSGEYSSLEQCQSLCAIYDTTYNCLTLSEESFCDQVIDSDGTGQFQTLIECEANCNITKITEFFFIVDIYPNPSSNIFNLEFNSDYETEIFVTNVLGEQVYFELVQSVNEFKTKIDLSNHSKGIYNLTIKSSDGISNHKLILH